MIIYKVIFMGLKCEIENRKPLFWCAMMLVTGRNNGHVMTLVSGRNNGHVMTFVTGRDNGHMP